MKRVIALVLPISAIILILIQPVTVNAITDIDERCIKQAYEIGYDLSESTQNIMNALAQLEADCVYSGMMSQEAKCLVWSYETGIRIASLILASPNSTDLADYYTDLVTHNCTNLDLLAGIDEPVIQVELKS